MTPIDLLAAPIRDLLDSVGTGSLSLPDPTAAVRDATAAIAATDARFEHALDALARDWESTAGDDARAAVRRERSQAAQACADGRTLTTVIDGASESVRRAATELRIVLDSFVRAADAVGPSVYTPAGVASILPIAATHVQRALSVVDRCRAELDGHAHRLETIGKTIAPGTPGDDRHRSGQDASADGARTHSASAVAAPIAHAGRPPTPGAVPITLPDGSVSYAPNQRAATAVRAALGQRGVPYVWGGTSPGRGLDCSALTQYAYRQAGVELPRLAQDQDTAGYRVDRAELSPGDLAVWSGHVAMYIGNGQMVEAGNPVQVSPVRTTNLDQVFEGFYRPR